MKKYLAQEFLDNTILSPEMETLRSITLDFYNLLDFFLDSLLIDKILNPIQGKLTEQECLRLSKTLNIMLLEIPLIRKCKLNRKNKFILQIRGDIEEINDIRNWFSHQRVYFGEISNLRKDRNFVLAKTKKFRKVMVCLIDYWLEWLKAENNKSAEQAYLKKMEDLKKELIADINRHKKS